MDKEEEQRYWIDSMPLVKPYGSGTLGIVDEEAGVLSPMLAVRIPLNFLLKYLTRMSK